MFRFPLRVILILPFVIQITATVGVVGYLSFRNGQKAVNDVADQLRHEVTNRIEDNLKNYLEIPHQVNQVKYDHVLLDNLNFENLTQWEKLLVKTVQSYPSINFTSVANNQGDYRTGERLSSGELRINLSGKETNFIFRSYQGSPDGKRLKLKEESGYFNVLKHPSYINAEKAGTLAWSDPYVSYLEETLLISALRPIYSPQNNQLQGVLITALRLDYLAKFLHSLKIGKKGQTFIMTQDGHLIASSTLEKPFKIYKNRNKEEQRELILAKDSQDTITHYTVAQLNEKWQNLSFIRTLQEFEFKEKKEKYFVQVLPFSNRKNLNWLIVVVVPESDFMGQITQNTQTTILLSAIALFMATLSGFATSQWLISPILKLKDSAVAISQGNFEQEVVFNRKDELQILANAFNSMAKQLRYYFSTLNAKNQELQELDKLKDEFLANTSHELRTPLNGIIGLAESLVDGVSGELSPSAIKNLKMIIASGKRLSSLVNDILDFSKLKHKSIELQLKPLGIREITEVILALSQPLTTHKNIELVNEIAEDLPLVYADENRLQQILYNLVGNAIKFTSQGIIKVSAKLSNDSLLEISVIDTGIGISKDKINRIFESFEQGDGSTAREYGGTGLGLTITKQLIELQGGTISVSSVVNEGSEFKFTLPIYQGNEENQSSLSAFSNLTASRNLIFNSMVNFISEINPELETNSDNFEGHKFKIMIVDDEPINLQVLSNHLALQRYTIKQANNGVEALEIIEKGFMPDLILLDVMMPKMTGYEVTESLRNKYSPTELPIVLLTAKTQVQDLVYGLNIGANDYLTKPISKEELIARIQTYLNLKQLQLENVRMGAELEITQRLQQMILPKPEELSTITGLDIAGFMQPATEVGGDYYDILGQDERVQIGIGDVTGHGLESGMLMLMIQTAIRTLFIHRELDRSKLLNTLNQVFYANMERIKSAKSCTLSLLDYDRQGTITIYGQHESVIHFTSEGQITVIDTLDLGLPLGLVEDIAEFINTTSLSLNIGDGILLYTDGITEAENSEKEFYGFDRLLNCLQCNSHYPAKTIEQAIITDVQQFVGNQIVYDDITLVVIKRQE